MESFNSSEYFVVKLDGKTIMYRKSKETNLGLLLICEENSFKRANLVEMSKKYLSEFEKKTIMDNLTKKNQIDYQFKNITINVCKY